MRGSAEDRFWARVDKTAGGPVPPGRPELGPCWPWTASTTYGYGAFNAGGGKNVRAPRFAYELAIGPIPDGLHLDHLCHTFDDACAGGDDCPHRRCCNPAHLEPVTLAENTRRGRSAQVTSQRRRARTHCIHGHEFTPENTRTDRRGRRSCKTCQRIGARNAYVASPTGDHVIKLTESLVREMRARALNGARQNELAADFGVSSRTVSNVVNGVSWKHVT